jgi:hypothetical protein
VRIVPRQRQDELLEAFKVVYASFYPEGSLKSPDTVNSAHYSRIMDLIGRTKGTIITGGTGDGIRIDLTIVKDVALDDALMEGAIILMICSEIFGPILTVIAVDSEDKALKIIRSQCAHPLNWSRALFIAGTGQNLWMFISSALTPSSRRNVSSFSWRISLVLRFLILTCTRSGGLVLKDTIQQIGSNVSSF